MSALKIFKKTPTTINAAKNPDAIVSLSSLLFIVVQSISKFSLVFPFKTIVLYVRNLLLYSMDIDKIFFASLWMLIIQNELSSIVSHSKMSLTHVTYLILFWLPTYTQLGFNRVFNYEKRSIVVFYNRNGIIPTLPTWLEIVSI